MGAKIHKKSENSERKGGKLGVWELGGSLEDGGGGATCGEFGSHIVHISRNVSKETEVAFAQVIMTGVAVAVGDKAVTRTLTVTGKAEAALTTLARKGSRLAESELLLAMTIEHGYQRRLPDVAQEVFRKYEMVAGVDIAIGLHSSTAATDG